MNVVASFTTGFSFFYSALFAASSVTVYAGLDATGTILATINFAAQSDGNNCTGDPTGVFCNWTAAGASFSRTAMSVFFDAAGHPTAFDNVTLGSETPGSVAAAVPEPASLLLVGAGLAGLGAFTWRRHPRK